MIKVTKLNGSEMAINPLLIEVVEAVPDTVITLTTGKKWIVRESLEEVQQRFASFLQGVGLATALGRQVGEQDIG